MTCRRIWHLFSTTELKKLGAAEGTDMVGTNGAISPGDAPNQPGELGDA